MPCAHSDYARILIFSVIPNPAALFADGGEGPAFGFVTRVPHLRILESGGLPGVLKPDLRTFAAAARKSEKTRRVGSLPLLRRGLLATDR
jgi:hypothetical protein